MLLSVALCLYLCVPVFNLDIPPIYAKILDDVSWTLKLKLLQDYLDNKNTTTIGPTNIHRSRRVGMESLVLAEPLGDIQNTKTNEKSVYINKGFEEKRPNFEPKSIYTKNIETSAEEKGSRYLETYPYRRFKGRRQDEVPSSPGGISLDDENDMRMKLFRLMYETVRDSDLKVKRAELIKTHYHNYTSFDIGYLMGDITDKYNVMQDVAKTLERLYNDWKPIEHINAYEQIANQAIEISHLIDMMRHMSKRNTTLL